MSVIADTSVWVEYLRRGEKGRAGHLARLIERDDAMICGPVLAEILAGARAEERDEVAVALGSLPWADLDREAWRDVGNASASVRTKGFTVAITDVEIAVACVRAGATLWTRDEDFHRIGTVLRDLQFFEPPRS